jgi:hypothetical protein
VVVVWPQCRGRRLARDGGRGAGEKGVGELKRKGVPTGKKLAGRRAAVSELIGG